jgi:hypothetical protein
MDTEANKAKKELLGRALTAQEKVSRPVWTQGSPPAYSFGRGHIFHELEASSDGIRRSIVVRLARPDPGALLEQNASNDAGAEETQIAEADESDGKEGFVDFEILKYKNGVLIVNEEGYALKEQSSRTQAGFVEFLRTGK